MIGVHLLHCCDRRYWSCTQISENLADDVIEAQIERIDYHDV